MTASPDPRMNTLTWSLLALLGLIWGGSFFFARIAVQHIPPFTLVFLRLSLAALALHLYLQGRFGFYACLKSRWREFALMGLLNNAVPHALIFMGQTQIGAGLAAILNATTPVWTVLIANSFTADEKLSGQKLAGCILGVLGTAVLIGPGAFAKTDIPFWALLLPVLAAVSYGIAATYGKRFRDLPAPVTAAGQLTASSMMILPVSLIVDSPWQLPAPPFEVIMAVLGIALLSTAFAYILFFRIMSSAGATNTSLVTLIVPVGAILLGAVFLGERLGLEDIGGMALIGSGLLLLDGRLFSSLRRLSRGRDDMNAPR